MCHLRPETSDSTEMPRGAAWLGWIAWLGDAAGEVDGGGEGQDLAEALDGRHDRTVVAAMHKI